MRKEATLGGFYQSELANRDYPRLQILSIRELLEEGETPDLPLLVLPAFQQAEKVVNDVAAGQQELFGTG